MVFGAYGSKRRANSLLEPAENILNCRAGVDCVNRAVKDGHSSVSWRDFDYARKLRCLEPALSRAHCTNGFISVGEIVAQPNEQGGVAERDDLN